MVFPHGIHYLGKDLQEEEEIIAFEARFLS